MQSSNRREKTSMLGQAIDHVPDDQGVLYLDHLDQSGPSSVFFCNVHMLTLAQSDPDLSAAMTGADYIFADGVPIKWLQQRLTRSRAARVQGYEAVLYLCGKCAKNNEPVGFYGARDETLDRLADRLRHECPGLQIPFTHSPAAIDDDFQESGELLDQINGHNLKYLFVGLGCPKQEKWIMRHRSFINCSLLGVGAAFDWLAGVERMPPKWMEQRGLAWLHRLSHHPVRMFHRYFVFNSKFVLLAALELRRARST
jgi:N-acetylglucosaminyldiphosphoundecaprenol N-acetyl-beta-D-mannosaminyltransferase